MIFGRLPLADAEGAILAHGLTLDGRRLKKGHRLSAADIEALGRAGASTVLAARREAGEIDEDEAAGRIAKAAAGTGTDVNAPFTGRCNIYAREAGVALIEREQIERMNRIDEAVTIATVQPFVAVEAGQMLATVKIIPFAAPATAVSAVEAEADDAVRLQAFRPHRAGVISTRLPETKASVIEKATELMRSRLERCGSTLGQASVVEHHEDDVAAAVRAQLDRGLAPILIFAASAITDRRDVIPAGIVAAGGRICHYGMPVDPGNLMLVGEVDGVPVIGAPGCARSPKENGFDWVLHRLLAGLDVGRDEIVAMGCGGLLMDTGLRGAPRERKTEGAPRMPKVAAIVLAAGQSRRMGRENKLLAPVAGRPMLTYAVDAALKSKAHPVIVVTGHEPDEIKVVLEGREVSYVHNARFADGLSTSLAQGLDAVPADSEAALICLGDMPKVSSGLIDRLISAYNPVEGRAVVVPTRDGKRGNPVLFDRRFFAEMREIAGDVGARHLIGEHEDLVAEIAVDDDAIFLDVDTPDALKRLTGS